MCGAGRLPADKKAEEIEVEINLNADLGESFGAWRMGDDRALLAVIGLSLIHI